MFFYYIIQLGVLNLSEPNSKEANILFLGQDMDCKEAVISSLSDEVFFFFLVVALRTMKRKEKEPDKAETYH